MNEFVAKLTPTQLTILRCSKEYTLAIRDHNQLAALNPDCAARYAEQLDGVEELIARAMFPPEAKRRSRWTSTREV